MLTHGLIVAYEAWNPQHLSAVMPRAHAVVTALIPVVCLSNDNRILALHTRLQFVTSDTSQPRLSWIADAAYNPAGSEQSFGP
jgi:hypothetical protein